jgi:DNA-binding SARP family transcriptional activator
MPVLSINMLGPITIEYKTEFLERKLSSKAVALICYLLINGDKKISREKIASYLWSENDEESSKYNLRYSLWNIKRIILPDKNGEEFIGAEKDVCYINKKYNFFSDILLLKECENKTDMSLEELLPLKKLFLGDFSEGLYIHKCPEFNDVILFERIVYQNKYVDLLKRILKKYEAMGQPYNCIEILKNILAIDPYNENFAYMLIDAYNKNGNRIAAISFYKNFEGRLRRNLNVFPAKALKDLYNCLITNDAAIIDLDIEKTIVKEKNLLYVETYCLKDINFFWISDVIGKIVESLGRQKLTALDPNYISDLASIQNKVLSVHEKNLKIADMVPLVRIINAFCEFLKCVCELRQLQIKTINYADMDSLSKDALLYIENNKIDGLEIIN